MIAIPYTFMNIFITACWILARAMTYTRTREFSLKREAQLILVYICIMVVARITLFPMELRDGHVQPLLFSLEKMLPPRLNLLPLVNILNYETLWESRINIIGNITMFIPIGVIFPAVYKKTLNTPGKAIAAGALFSLTIETLQLFFFERMTDVDDLILNTLGYVIGYGLYLLAKKLFKDKKEAS